MPSITSFISSGAALSVVAMYSAFNDFPSSSLDKSSSILERASLLSCRMSPLKCFVCPMKSALRSTTRYLNTRRGQAKDYEACVRGWFPYQGLRLSPTRAIGLKMSRGHCDLTVGAQGDNQIPLIRLPALMP